jgi:heme exporter protein B
VHGPASETVPAGVGGQRRLPGFLAQIGLIVRKDLLIEAKSGEVTITSAFFALLVVVLSSMSFHGGPRTGRLVCSGVIWLSVAFAAVLSLGRSWAREREGRALVGLLTSPLEPGALFLGKVLTLTLFLFAIELVVFPVSALFFSVDLLRYGPGLAMIGVLATPGIAAAGTLFGAMTARTAARDLVLSIVLFPLLAPVLLAAVGATRGLLAGTPVGELGSFFRLMGVFDVLFLVGGVAFLPVLLED